MPDGEKTVTEWRLLGVDEDGCEEVVVNPIDDREGFDYDAALAKKHPPSPPYGRYVEQSRTVTTTPWKDAPDA